MKAVLDVRNLEIERTGVNEFKITDIYSGVKYKIELYVNDTITFNIPILVDIKRVADKDEGFSCQKYK